MTVTFKILGSGAGTGVPAFFCNCSGCMEARQKPEYARSRSGVFISTNKWYPDSHMTVNEAIELGTQLQAGKTILTHLSMHYSQAITNEKLKEEVAKHPEVLIAQDGMTLELK